MDKTRPEVVVHLLLLLSDGYWPTVAGLSEKEFGYCQSCSGCCGPGTAGRAPSARDPVPWGGLTENKPCPLCPSDFRARLGSPQGCPSGRMRMSHLTRARGSQQHEAGGLAGGPGAETRGSGDKNKLLDLLAEQCST